MKFHMGTCAFAIQAHIFFIIKIEYINMDMTGIIV